MSPAPPPPPPSATLAPTCRMGSAKAPVLPLPVCARPITSLSAQRKEGRAGSRSQHSRRGCGSSMRSWRLKAALWVSSSNSFVPIFPAFWPAAITSLLTLQHQRHCLLLDRGGALPAKRSRRLCELLADTQLLEGGHRLAVLLLAQRFAGGSHSCRLWLARGAESKTKKWRRERKGLRASESEADDKRKACSAPKMSYMFLLAPSLSSAARKAHPGQAQAFGSYHRDLLDAHREHCK